MSEAPTLSEIIDSAVARRLRALRASEPGEVLAYDAATCKATVQPWILEGYYDADGVRRTKRRQAITNVPVVFLATNDGFRQTIPLARGDTVMILYTDSSLDRWLVRGGVTDPADDRSHAPSDAVAIPTLRDFAHALENVGALPAIGYPDALIEFTSTQIRAGGTSQLATLADLQALRDWVSDQLHPVGGHTHASLGAPPTLGLGGGVYTDDPPDPDGTMKLRGA